MLVFQAAILKQPDFGAAMSLAVLTFAMLFLSGTRLRYLASLFGIRRPRCYHARHGTLSSQENYLVPQSVG